MGKQWVRQEIKKNEIASFLESARFWLRERQQIAAGVGIGAVVLALIAASTIHRRLQAKEEAWGRLAIAQSYAYSGRIDAALQQLRDIYETSGSNLAAGYSLLTAGDILYQQGRYAEAAQTYQKILEAAPHKGVTPLAMASLGISQEAARDCKSAVETDERFLEGYQDHFMAPQVHASLARCLNALGQLEKAKATYERMVFLYPDTYWAAWAKAHIKS